jgi:hypothetical protein
MSLTQNDGTVTYSIKGKDEMLVPNTALKERSEPGFEKSFPDISSNSFKQA